MNEKQKESKKHEVTHEYSGKIHFFKVKTETGKTHSVSVQVGCDCKYMGVQGLANGKICSHVLAVFNDVILKGNIRLTLGSEQMVQLRRNACISLVRRSNRSINEVKVSSGESQEHMDKKIEVCKRLTAEGKHFMTEAIFEQGGGRADILVLDSFTVIEIVKTESFKSIKRKIDEYPEGIKFEVVRC